MKGFIRILEAIVASLIILTALTFFFNTTIKPSNWDDTFLQVRAQDIVASLSINGTINKSVSTNDQTIINDAILNPNIFMLPITVDYSVTVEGIPNPVIRIGCNCTDSQMQDLKDTLSPSVVYNGRTITFVVYQAEISRIHEDANADTNILFLNGYKNLTQFDDGLRIFMKRGGTIFLLGDLTQSQVNDCFVNETFGLKWVAGTRSNTGRFFDNDNENITSFKISKYYAGITPEPEPFSFLGAATIATDNRTIIRGDTGLSLAKINTNIVDGNGRVVWLSGSTGIANVTKSLVMWGSGEKFDLNSKKPSPSKYFKTFYMINGRDSYKIVLTLWKVFQ